MRIQPGQPAKNFTSQDILGHSVALPDYKGQRLMLSFYRYAACPLCNLRMHHLYFLKSAVRLILYRPVHGFEDEVSYLCLGKRYLSPLPC